jgi:hypothetical protein
MNLEYIKSKRALITKTPWRVLVGRKHPKRLDIYSGPFPEVLPEVDAVPQLLDRNVHQIVTHSHPITPNVLELNANAQNDSEFIAEAPEMIDWLIAELEKK